MKKLYLEFVRGAAAVTVLIYHCIELHPTASNTRHYYFSNWGTDAVMVFFILSGLVINLSQTKNPKSKAAFLFNRLLRLLPQFFIGILMAIAALLLTRSFIPNDKVIAGNIFMLSTLQGFIVPCLVSNSPLWSLSFEVFFYLLFMLTIGRYQKKTLRLWFFAALSLFPLYYFKLELNVYGHLVAVLSFSAIWLVGYYIYQFRHRFYADVYAAVFSLGCLPLISRLHISTIYYDPLKYLIFTLFAVPFFRYCLQIPGEGCRIKLIYLLTPYLVLSYIVFTQPYITFTNWVLYSGLPLLFMAFIKFIRLTKSTHKLKRLIDVTSAVTGKYSYSLYISHYPVLFVCAAFFPRLWQYITVSMALVVIIAYLLESRFQPVIINLFEKASVKKREPEQVFTSST